MSQSQRPGLFVVCNPATRQWTSLPALVAEPRRFAAVACGFYLHGESGEYRLLCHIEYRRRSYYYILAAGAAVPRRLGRAPHPRSSEYDVPVARRGVLHWLASHPEASTGKMLAFDTASETFHLMSPPPPDERAGDTAATASGLLEVDGELIIMAATPTQRGATASMAIWALEDYEAEAWTLRCRVEVPSPSPSLPTLFRGGCVNRALPNRFLSVGDGEILIGNCSSLYDARLYDLKNRRMVGAARLYDLRNRRMLGEISFVHDNPTFLMFRESLVSHAFFNLRK